jgi:hypothetical protein
MGAPSEYERRITDKHTDCILSVVVLFFLARNLAENGLRKMLKPIFNVHSEKTKEDDDEDKIADFKLRQAGIRDRCAAIHDLK